MPRLNCLMSCDSQSSVALPHGAVGWSEYQRLRNSMKLGTLLAYLSFETNDTSDIFTLIRKYISLYSVYLLFYLIKD